LYAEGGIEKLKQNRNQQAGQQPVVFGSNSIIFTVVKIVHKLLIKFKLIVYNKNRGDRARMLKIVTLFFRFYHKKECIRWEK
jgi:hypothetical protein